MGLVALGRSYAAFHYARRTKAWRGLVQPVRHQPVTPQAAAAPSPAPSRFAALERRDPGFSSTSFLAHAKGTFTRVQDAWFLRTMDAARDVVSDATWQRFSTQLRLMERQGVRDAITDLRLQTCEVVGVRTDRLYDALEVRFTAALRDADAPATASDEEARAAAAAAPLEHFTEFWTFLRSVDATTAAAPGKCPQCGAPFTGNQAGQCTHCKALLNSGRFSWVLTEITQKSEVNLQLARPPGVEALEARDPAFSLEVLEDRASLLFWRWVDAHDAGAPVGIANVATPAFHQRFTAELERRAHQGLRRPFTNAAVGAVLARRLTVEDGHDVAACEVRWSAAGLASRSALLLKRRVDARTPLERGLSTGRCPTCAAPLGDGGQPACEYCGEALAARASDWVLDAVLSWRSS